MGSICHTIVWLIPPLKNIHTLKLDRIYFSIKSHRGKNSTNKGIKHTFVNRKFSHVLFWRNNCLYSINGNIKTFIPKFKNNITNMLCFLYFCSDNKKSEKLK